MSNPYAPPSASIADPTQECQVWREGNTLVVSAGAQLPGRCVKCASPEVTERREVAYQYVPRWSYALLVISTPIFFIVYLLMRKSSKLALPLCEEHAAHSKKLRMLGLALIFGGLGGGSILFFGGLAIEASSLIGGGSLLGGIGLVVGIVLWNRGSKLLRVERITKLITRLRGAHADYLDALPSSP